jgi:hypothetical protein
MGELPDQEVNGLESSGGKVNVHGEEKLRQEPARNRTTVGPRGKDRDDVCPRDRDDPRQNDAGLQIDGTKVLLRVSQASS